MKKWALLAGVDEYEPHSGIANLRYAGRDAVATGRALRQVCGFDEVHVLAGDLPGSEGYATGNAIFDRIEFAIQDLRPDDIFVLGVFMHGTSLEVDGVRREFLLPRDARSGRTKTYLEQAMIEQELERLGARRRVLFWDCCRDNPTAARGTEAHKLETDVARDLSLAAPLAYGGVLASTCVLTACSPGGRAYESDRFKHGVFAYHLLRGIEGAAWRQDELDVRALGKYVQDEIGGNASFNQLPRFRQEGAEAIVLAVRAPAPMARAAVEVKEYAIEPIEVDLGKVVSEAPGPDVGLLPEEVRDIQARILGLEQAVAALEDGTHPSLDAANRQIREADAQARRLEEDCAALWARLAPETPLPETLAGRFASGPDHVSLFDMVDEPGDLAAIGSYTDRLDALYAIRNAAKARSAHAATRTGRENARRTTIDALAADRERLLKTLRGGVSAWFAAIAARQARPHDAPFPIDLYLGLVKRARGQLPSVPDEALWDAARRTYMAESEVRGLAGAPASGPGEATSEDGSPADPAEVAESEDADRAPKPQAFPRRSSRVRRRLLVGVACLLVLAAAVPLARIAFNDVERAAAPVTEPDGDKPDPFGGPLWPDGRTAPAPWQESAAIEPAGQGQAAEGAVAADGRIEPLGVAAATDVVAAGASDPASVTAPTTPEAPAAAPDTLEGRLMKILAGGGFPLAHTVALETPMVPELGVGLSWRLDGTDDVIGAALQESGGFPDLVTFSGHYMDLVTRRCGGAVGVSWGAARLTGDTPARYATMSCDRRGRAFVVSLLFIRQNGAYVALMHQSAPGALAAAAAAAAATRALGIALAGLDSGGGDDPPPPPVLSEDATPEVVRLADLAAQGNPNAEHDLARAYALGDGVSRDYTKAAYWYRRAADAGMLNAIFNLGVLTDNGWGVERDPAEAVRLYLKAAEGGHPDAQNAVGLAYTQGYGTEADPTEAVRWFKAASTNGNPRGAFNLGQLYERGWIGPPDLIQAAGWYQIAAEHGVAEARDALTRLEAVGVKPGAAMQ